MPFDSTTPDLDRPLIDEVDVLLKMKQALRVPQLWTRRDYVAGNSHCILGALYLIDHGDPEVYCLRHPASLYVQRRLRELILTKVTLEEGLIDESVVVHFNDHRSTTHAQVMELLDEAIASFEAERI